MSWPKVAIADFCRTGSGGTPSRNHKVEYYGGNIPWVKSGELLDDSLRFTEECITEKALLESSAKLIPPGAVLIAMYGATVGRTALLGIEAATNQAICFVLPDERLAVGRYVWYALRSSYNDLLAKRVGGAQPNISQQIIKTTKLPLPSLTEQSRIVELLDDADRLRKLRREADTKAARILPTLFLKMFGDPVMNPMGWEVTTVENLVAETNYGTSTKALEGGDGLPMIRMGNVDYEGHLDLSDLKYVQLSNANVARFRLEKGDILFNRTNSKELVGKTGLWDANLDAVAASYFIRVRINTEEVTPTFFWALMNSAYMKRLLRATARGAIGQANINSTELRALSIYKPPLHLQKLFSEKWEQIRLTVPYKVSQNNNLDRLFSVLMSHAFSGKLTAQWREGHMQELLAEMAQQARLLNLPLPQDPGAAP